MRKQDAIFLVSNNGAEIISFGALLAPEGCTVQHKVKVGGGSFTDSKIMETGLPEFMINDEEDEFNPTFTRQHGKYVLKALTAHEYGHIWFTNFHDFKSFLSRMTDKFVKEGINEGLAMHVVKNFFNITEDGRIEKRMVNLYPGLINYFRYLNGTVWQIKDNVPEDELNIFMDILCTYTVVGIKPKWYKDINGSRPRDEFEKIEHMVEDCINAPTCKANCDKTEAIIDAIWDYLLELLKDIQSDAEKMQDFLDQYGSQLDFGEGCSEAGSGTEAGEGSRSARIPSEEGEEGAGKSGKEKGEGEGASGAKDDSSDSGETHLTGDNSGAAGSTLGQKQEVPKYKKETKFSTDSPSYDYSGVSGDGGGSTKVIKSKEGHVTKTPEQLIEDIVKEVESEIKSQEPETKTTSSSKKKKSESSKITREDISRMVTSVGYDKEHVRLYREERNNYRMLSLPQEYRPMATSFRRKVQKCFNEKNTLLNKMNSGRLNVKELHRFAMKEYNVFQKKVNRSNTEAVVEICWDGSGSMCGGKQHYSAMACSVIEEGLKDLVPLKIINFSVDWSHQEVVHYLVKDFDENDKKINYSTSYSKSKSFNGGNKDGYSIRVCTEDLLRRPEKDKILIVMSDGLPSDYNSINPQEDVKDAVKVARRKGIIVIPIFFGDEYFRQSVVSEYEYMYEKHIINSSPEELPERLVKLLQQLVLR